MHSINDTLQPELNTMVIYRRDTRGIPILPRSEMQYTRCTASRIPERREILQTLKLGSTPVHPRDLLFPWSCLIAGKHVEYKPHEPEGRHS